MKDERGRHQGRRRRPERLGAESERAIGRAELSRNEIANGLPHEVKADGEQASNHTPGHVHRGGEQRDLRATAPTAAQAS